MSPSFAPNAVVKSPELLQFLFVFKTLPKSTVFEYPGIGERREGFLRESLCTAKG